MIAQNVMAYRYTILYPMNSSKMFCLIHRDQSTFSNFKSSALSNLFEYLCYWSTAIINVLIISVQDHVYYQDLTSSD